MQKNKGSSGFQKKKSGRFGVVAICKSCESNKRSLPEYRAKERLRINSNPGLLKKRNEQTKKWKFENKSKVAKIQKNWFLKNLYGIGISEYNLMYENQNGRCAICNTHQSELKKSLCVDHDHETGKIRGLLCSDCNTSLGLAKENVEILHKMIRYLKGEIQCQSQQ